MTQLVRAALVQLDFDPRESFDARLARAADLIAAQRGCDLVVLPELWPNGGFTYETWEETAQSLTGPLIKVMSQAAREVGAVLHMGSFVEQHIEPIDGRHLTNTSVVFDAFGDLIGVYRKIHLFGFSEGEPQLMGAGHQVVTVDSAVGRLGLATCYDLRFPELFTRLADAGTELAIIPAAWPAARVEHWRVLLKARAIENQYPVLAVNTVGSQHGKTMGGYSVAIDARGEVLAEATGDREEVMVVDVDLAAAQQWRAEFPVRADRRLT